jgi:hypothetical protein
MPGLLPFTDAKRLKKQDLAQSQKPIVLRVFQGRVNDDTVLYNVVRVSYLPHSIFKGSPYSVKALRTRQTFPGEHRE